MIVKQKTAFGPGVYRGQTFDSVRLKRFVDGTNLAIAAGIPVPLLKRHAKLKASDTETDDAAKREGVGFLKKLAIAEDGSIEWEADGVPEDAAKAINDKTLRFTSPEFRENYKSEKEGVYTGPIIRHFAFTPLPGNPHQGEIRVESGSNISALALEESLEDGIFQFDESEREPLVSQHAEKSHLYGVHEYDSAIGDYALKDLYDDEETAKSQAAGIPYNGMIHGIANPPAKVMKYPKSHKVVKAYQAAGNKIHQFAEKKPPKDEAPEEEVVEGGLPPEMPLPNAPIVDPGMVNPDILPPVFDRMKTAAVLSGLADKGIILPSDFDFSSGASLDILLAALNSSLKAERDAEAKNQQPLMESPPPTEAAMPFAELFNSFYEDDEESDQQFAHREPADDDLADEMSMVDDHNVRPPASTGPSSLEERGEHALHGHRQAILANLSKKKVKGIYDHEKAKKLWGYYAKHLSEHYGTHNGGLKANPATQALLASKLADKYKDRGEQFDEIQFSEEELTAMGPKTRKAIEAGQRALAAEREARKVEAERIQQFEEDNRLRTINAARDKANAVIQSAPIPPALRERLVLNYTTMQFAEGEQTVYTPSDVAALIQECFPPEMLQFSAEDVVPAKAPVANSISGVNNQNGRPLLTRPTEAQFFEQGDGPVPGHVSPERANELVKTSPVMRNTHAVRPHQNVTVAERVRQDNAANPNKVMHT